MKSVIIQPIGLCPFRAEVETNCAQAHLFHKGHLQPASLIVPLDAGNGRTTAAEYMADMYKQHQVLGFISGLDDVVEISFDGTVDQLQNAYTAISDAACYMADNDHIVTIDVTSLIATCIEEDLAGFIQRMKRLCRTACVLFFVRSVPSRAEERMIDKLLAAIPNLKRLPAMAYSPEECSLLVEKLMADHSVEVEHSDAFRSSLQNLVELRQVSALTDAQRLTEQLIPYADFNGLTPSMTADALIRAIAAIAADYEEDKIK